VALAGHVSVLERRDRAGVRLAKVRPVRWTHLGCVSCLALSSHGCTMPLDTSFLCASGSAALPMLRVSTCSAVEIDLAPDSQEVAGDTKRCDDDDGQGVEGGISLGESVDVGRGGLDVLGRGELVGVDVRLFVRGRRVR